MSDRRTASYERSGSEGLVDLHVYVIPVEQWKVHLSSVLHQLITDSISAGYIRVHPESVLSDLRNEINSQLGFESVPRDYVFLRCLGRSFTQVKQKQEHDLKAKYFMPPHTYSPELYVLEATTAQHYSTSSQSSQHSLPGEHTSRVPLPPPSYPAATTRPYASQDNGYNDREKASEHQRQTQREEEPRRKRFQELEEEEKRRRRLREEEEEEEERTKRIIEELEVMRREELEGGRKTDEKQDVQRMRKLEQEEEDRLRLRRLVEEEGRRGGVHHMESQIDEFSRSKTPSPTPRQRTIENETRVTWKKRFLEEKKRTPSREEKTKALKEELDNINRTILDQMETLRDGGKRISYGQPISDSTANNAKLEATSMEQDIDSLQHKLQSTKLQLTAEIKLRNQCEQELWQLKSELEHQKANSRPRFEEKVITKSVEVPVYINNGNDDEDQEPQYEPIVKRATVHVTYKDPPQEENSIQVPVSQSGSLEEAFRVFATKNNGTEATGADIFKWGADAGIIGKSLNNHHLDISFHKVKPKGMKTITLKELHPLVDELAVKYRDDTKLSYQGSRRRLIDRLSNAPFKLHGATHTVRTGGVARLTNVSRYTGPIGKGRGKQDRGIVVDNTGYVHRYD